MSRPRSRGRSRPHTVEARRAAVPTITYPEELPVSQRRDEIAAAIRDHQVVVVAGETGSGKTTQLPKICLELGRGIEGRIGHTQPRRLAARTVADRIADELQVELGTAVGYAVRFTDQVRDDTLVKLMTDGILLAELRHDRLLSAYDTIIVDEAHERSLNIDFLLGSLVQLLPKRPDLKVIITSATIETERFSKHFATPADPDGAPVIEVSGRTYPVELRHRPLDPLEVATEDELADGITRSQPRDQITAIVEALDELRREPPGDVLVFLSGEREIRDTEHALRDLDLRETEILPLYARLSLAEQHRVFAPHTGRRVVLATNVAETSLTVPGIRYVIDPGTARVSRYSTRLKVQRLPIEPVSQASANQRAGRCGRVADGVCIRLYSEDDFDSRPAFTDPEILRTNLASVILQMTDIGLGDIADFPFLDPPDRRAIADGVRLLDELGALAPVAEGEPTGAPRRLTDVGRRLARLPVDPRFARMVIEAAANDCVREVLVIVAALSIQDPRERPADNPTAADQHHARFKDERSDFIAYLNLWTYVREQQRRLSSSQFRKLCRREHLNFLRIREWQDVHAQLKQVTRDLELRTNTDPAPPDAVHRSLLAGLLSHLGQRNRDTREYVGARNARFMIFPGSTLSKRQPEWVMAAELVETSRLWAREVAAIHPEWVEPLAGHLVKRSYSEPHWSRRRGSAMAYERVTLFGLPIVSERLVNYGTIDRAHARELFIRHALVEGDWVTHHRFVAANRTLLADVEELEHRFRRRDLVLDEALEALYDARLPSRIVSGRHFDSWWKKARRHDPDQLTFALDDLLPAGAGLDEDAFPAEWHQGRLTFGLSYAFDPGQADDGVAVHIPVAVLNQVKDEGFEWLVPGLRHELVVELIRTLPKAKRRDLVPLADTADAVLATVDPHEPLLPALAAALNQRSDEPIPSTDLDRSRLPAHLRMLFVVVDEQDDEVARGEDLGALQRLLATEVRSAIAGAGADLDRDDVTDWDFGELPHVVERRVGDQIVQAYPSLVDQGDRVAVRVLESAEEQQLSMWDGTRRLLRMRVPTTAKRALHALSNEDRLALSGSPYRSVAELIDDAVAASVDEVMTAAGGPAWDAVAFDALLDRTSRDLPALVSETMRHAATVLRTSAELDRRLATFAGPGADEVIVDIDAQRSALVYDGFVAGVGRARLLDIDRYLRAALHRLDKQPGQPARDRDRMATIHALERRYHRLLDALPPGVAPPEAMVDVAWMLEELRVSLFAQALGTPVPISEKRVAQALDRLTAEWTAAR